LQDVLSYALTGIVLVSLGAALAQWFIVPMFTVSHVLGG
jgi:hypothetical protein